jgi:hypothetical protein
MESTGIYWIPIDERLNDVGIGVYLVNARYVTIVPGRKTDDNDAQWLQKLPALGLLHASFRPDDALCGGRGWLRPRAPLVVHRSPHLLHRHKPLKLMNIQRPNVRSDVTGVTGFAILRAMRRGPPHLDANTVVVLPDARLTTPCRSHATTYRITSSARERSVGGMVTPRVLAVFRLMTSSNFMGSSTGKSAGLAPLRMRST